ncbi:helix-turn-helix domain-containing protein [Kitasatospora phosalacinea]|nr:helix-turn-helix domain-containing protein [Kitasatospora phosalacinea]
MKTVAVCKRSPSFSQEAPAFEARRSGFLAAGREAAGRFSRLSVQGVVSGPGRTGGVRLRCSFRLYPTKHQQPLLARTFGCAQVVHNDWTAGEARCGSTAPGTAR